MKMYIILLSCLLVLVCSSCQSGGDSGRLDEMNKQSGECYLLWPSLGEYQAWGDYGSALIHGSLTRDGKERVFIFAGSELPDLFLPHGELVVSADVYEEIHNKYPHVIFSKVTKVVRKKIAWEKWCKINDPELYPESGDPCDYVYGNYFDSVDLTGMCEYYCVEECETLDFKYDGMKSYCSESFYQFLMLLCKDRAAFVTMVYAKKCTIQPQPR